MIRRVVLVLDVDTDKLPGEVGPAVTPERIREFVEQAPPEATVVLVKIDGETLYNREG